MELIGIADPAFWTRFGVHYGLFLGAIRSGATANQFSYWLDKGVLGLNGITGCFAMTELAHVGPFFFSHKNLSSIPYHNLIDIMNMYCICRALT
jgi:hypothetical protein